MTAHDVLALFGLVVAMGLLFCIVGGGLIILFLAAVTRRERAEYFRKARPR